MASVRPSLKVIKQFTFRGATRRWSNRYYVSGPTPADSAHWTTFSDAVVTAEKATMGSDMSIVETLGYAAGSDVPVFTKTYATAGTLTLGAGWYQQGEVAALVRYSTAARTSKNHPLYLFNYYHHVQGNASTSPDSVTSGQATALQTYATAWVSGFSDGTNLMVRCGPQGNLATGSLVEPLLTHRDFPRA